MSRSFTGSAESTHTVERIHAAFGRERARQIEKRLVTRLRSYLQSELGEAVQIALGQE